MRREDFYSLAEKLGEGIRVGEVVLLAGKPKPGRFSEEFNLDLFVQKGNLKRPLLHAKVFLGRREYRDWVELFGISGEVFGKTYFGSELEAFVLDSFSSLTGRIFVEYFEDMETVRELSAGVPPALSRLGFELAKRGFTWFKDWYFPEGLMEGGHKLQAEKAVNDEKRKRHLESLKGDLQTFLDKCGEESLKERVVERFKILEGLWKRNSF